MLAWEGRKLLLQFLRSESHGDGASEAEIRAAELRLGVRLPGAYRDFLREFGWAAAGPFEFFGLGPSIPPYLDLVATTLEERTLYRPYIPWHLVPLLNDGFGNHYCLDTSQMNAGECPVVFWNHELDESQTPEPVADNYEMWLVGLLDDLAADM
jgi:cell wall assembly regulator SMI1